MALSRADTSVLGRWWWTVDRWTLGALLILIGFGYIMMLAASPAVATRIGMHSADGFIVRQVGYLVVAAIILVATSLLTPRGVRRLALVGCFVAIAMTAATLFIGVEIKGARRWISLPLLGSLQPSEFLKPCFAVVAAWLIAEGKAMAQRRAEGERGFFPGSALTIALYGVIALLLKSQPDIGMLIVVSSVLLAQFFVAGLNLFLVGATAALGAAGGVAAFFLFDHVRSRVMRFWDPAAGDNYQVNRALEAFSHGGLFGAGPGEGRVKNVLPDAHADFVFAVAGEEYGLIICLVILAIFGFIVIRGLLRLLAEADLFIVLSSAGLLTQFGLQAFVNMASSLHLIPTKGMTLPFVSYGGSSVFAIALGMGMLLALTRRRGGRIGGDA